MSEALKELKQDRVLARDSIRLSICKNLQMKAQGGFLPSIDEIFEEVLHEVSVLMDTHDHVPVEAWSAILQREIPGPACKKLQKITERQTCQKKESTPHSQRGKNGATDAERTAS